MVMGVADWVAVVRKGVQRLQITVQAVASHRRGWGGEVQLGEWMDGHIVG